MKGKGWLLTLAVTTLLFLCFSDKFYFDGLQKKIHGSVINESIIRDGRLGQILIENNLLTVAENSQDLAFNDLCASDVRLSKSGRPNHFRLRLKLLTNVEQEFGVTISFPGSSADTSETWTLTLEPNVSYYAIDFLAQQRASMLIELKTSNELLESAVNVQELQIDAQTNQNLTLMKDGNPVIGQLMTNRISTSQVLTSVIKPQSSLLYYLETPLPDDYFKLQLYGKKLKGYCDFTFNQKSYSAQELNYTGVPIVALNVSEENLYGENGILMNLDGRGRKAEVPANVIIANKTGGVEQKVGLRFHGGVHRRKKNGLNGYRLYARAEYGKSTFDEKKIFRYQGSDLKTLVLRSNQSYSPRDEDYGVFERGFNPYSHALAYDVARSIGALVTRSELVDFRINDKKQDLYFALEHLSRRTIKSWLGNDDFELYVYKKSKSELSTAMYKDVMQNILNQKGNKAYDALKKHYDEMNVINSIILTAYVGDDYDYCQGVEIFENIKGYIKTGDPSDIKITTVNWDLDHAFFKFDINKWQSYIDVTKMAFRLVGRGVHPRCHRKTIYSHVYAQSPIFRQEFRQRFEQLLLNELSPSKIHTLIKKYKRIDEQYYLGRYNAVIDKLREFAMVRPAVLKLQLNQTEKNVSNEVRELDRGK